MSTIPTYNYFQGLFQSFSVKKPDMIIVDYPSYIGGDLACILILNCEVFFGEREEKR